MSMQLVDFLIFCTTTASFLWHQKNSIDRNFADGATCTSSIEPSYQDTTNSETLKEALKRNQTLNATENVCTVTSDNIPIPNGHLRSQMRLEKLWHRATYIIVRHEENENDNDDKNKSGNDTPEYKNTFILVQRRSNIKDYCPGKLDPTPGGVVGYNESYEENAIREIEEEMNIKVVASSQNNQDPNKGENTITKLFTFPYQDDNVNVWGEMYEVVYKGKLSDIVCQPEEVSEVKRLSLSEIQDMIENNPDDWMPDGLYALKLYLQRKSDMKVKKRLFKGDSSGDLDRYRLRPKPKVIFFDCDDCLYFDGWKVANQLTAKIEEWCTSKMQLPTGKAYELYKQHGTALRGLLAEGLIENKEEAIDDYLRDVHDVPVHEYLDKDHALRDMLLGMDPTIPKFIFTASVRHHAERCLKALGIDDLFIDIIDVKTCNLATKHSKEAFEAAMSRAGVIEPECCVFLDDSTRNIEAARSMGWRSILVGKIGRDCGTIISSDHAEHEIDSIHDLPSILPELFP